MMKILFLLLLSGLLIVSACVQENNENITENNNSINDEDVNSIDESDDSIIDSNNNIDDDVNDDVNNDVNEDNVESDVTSIEQLILAGSPVHCTYEGEIEGENIRYEIYIADEKYKVETTFLNQNQDQDTFMINDGDYVYIWDSSLNGMKYEVSAFDDNMTDDGEDSGTYDESIDRDLEVSYSCTSWSPSANSFEPPEDVTFVDYSEMFNMYQ